MTSPFAALTEPPALSLRECLWRARRAVSPRYGIVAGVDVMPGRTGGPSAWWVRARPSDTTAIFGQAALDEGMACSTNQDRALIKALGEVFERYCAASYDRSDLKVAPHSALDVPATPPEAFARFLPEQALASATCDTPVAWVQGFSLTHQQPWLVPASSVYVPYRSLEGEQLVLPWMASTGLACHTSYAGAVYKCLVELAERDAFMIRWLKRLPGDTIEPAGLRDPLTRDLLRAAQAAPWELHLRLLTLDLPVPVIMAAFVRDNPAPYTLVGCGADLDPEVALRLALEEGLLTLLGFSSWLDKVPDFDPGEDFENVAEIRLHGLAHAACPDLKASMRDFLASSRTQPLRELQTEAPSDRLSQIAWLTDHFAERSLDLIAVDLTTPDIDALGFKVVRVVCPGAQPLDVDHKRRHLGGQRLHSVPRSLGLDAVEGFNPFPHPFP